MNPSDEKEFDELTAFLEIRPGDGMQQLLVEEGDRQKIKQWCADRIEKSRQEGRDEAVDYIEKQVEGWVLDQFPTEVLKRALSISRNPTTKVNSHD